MQTRPPTDWDSNQKHLLALDIRSEFSYRHKTHIYLLVSQVVKVSYSKLGKYSMYYYCLNSH